MFKSPDSHNEEGSILFFIEEMRTALMKKIAVDKSYIIENLLKKALKRNDICLLETQRLGGLTNENYKVVTNDNIYFVRLPGNRTQEFINRRDEYKITRLVGTLGIDSPLIYFNVSTGIKISRFIEGGETLHIERIKGNREMLVKVASLFKKLHSAKFDWTFAFSFFNKVKEFEEVILNSPSGTFLPNYLQFKDRVFQLQKEIDLKYPLKAICHHDSLCENFILQKERLFLTDWEYSGLNHPIWDLAEFTLEAELCKEDEILLCQCYNPRSTIKDLPLLMQMHKVLADFLWSLWRLMKYHLEKEPIMLERAHVKFERAHKNYQRLGNFEG